MHAKIPSDIVLPEIPHNSPSLPYEKPELGQNYWLKDNFFPDEIAKDIANRCFNKKKMEIRQTLYKRTLARHALKKRTKHQRAYTG